MEKYKRAKGAKKIIKPSSIGLNGILMGFFRGVLLQIFKMNPCKIRFKEIEHIELKAEAEKMERQLCKQQIQILNKF